MTLDHATITEKDKNPKLGNFANFGESKQRGLKEDFRRGALNKANVRIIKSKKESK